ncbi:MAG: helix-turn-helix transcriptional regulator, partial [Candidatus Levybacteria bacterium]|nr:helix-turn-helix transcriptional regulator [Candidatus Levybacteria bacterium]
FTMMSQKLYSRPSTIYEPDHYYIDWKPSVKFLKKARRIYMLHEKGLTYREIAKKVGHHRAYVGRLGPWYKTHVVEKGKHE